MYAQYSGASIFLFLYSTPKRFLNVLNAPQRSRSWPTEKNSREKKSKEFKYERLCFFLNENEMKVKDQMEKIMKTDTEDTHVKISLGFGIV